MSLIWDLARDRLVAHLFGPYKFVLGGWRGGWWTNKNEHEVLVRSDLRLIAATTVCALPLPFRTQRPLGELVFPLSSSPDSSTNTHLRLPTTRHYFCFPPL